MSALLASVRSEAEARIAMAVGVDLLDLKDPGEGALGALPLDAVQSICAAIGRTVPISATVGDLAPVDSIVAQRVEALATTPVDIIKLGMFGDYSQALSALPALRATLRSDQHLVLVLPGLEYAQPEYLSQYSQSSIDGVMIDTFDKHEGSLLDRHAPEQLKEFVRDCQRFDLFCGLAGSLRLDDIASLGECAADFLGFRGALCAGDRSQSLDSDLLAQVRKAMSLTRQNPDFINFIRKENAA